MTQLPWRVLVALTLALGALLSRTGFTPPAFSQGGAWTVTPSPNQGTRDNNLLGISAASPSAVWAVGTFNPGPYDTSLSTLIEFWNGASWSIVPSPNPANATGDYDALQGVAAVSPDDVWAVGYSGCVSCDGDQNLIEHWNGSAWSVVPIPSPHTEQDLYAIAAISANDIWAVGRYGYFPYGALIEHWNGTQWSEVANPGTQALHGVTAVSSNDVWAVGDGEIMHWNGVNWSVVPSPPSTSYSSYFLRAVTAVSADDVWADGFVEVGSGEGYTYTPVVEHWNGSSWQLSYGLNPGQTGTLILGGITALSASSVWAVGGMAGVSFIERWDGTQWTPVSNPNPSSEANRFWAATSVPATGDVWAAGQYFDTATSTYRTLIEVSRGNATDPPGTATAVPTATPTLPAPTATPSPTPAPKCRHKRCA